MSSQLSPVPLVQSLRCYHSVLSHLCEDVYPHGELPIAHRATGVLLFGVYLLAFGAGTAVNDDGAMPIAAAADDSCEVVGAIHEQEAKAKEEAEAEQERQSQPAPAQNAPAPAPTPEPESNNTDGSGPYKNCTEARNAGAAPVYRREPGYGSHLDRDGDGIGCEQAPQGSFTGNPFHVADQYKTAADLYRCGHQCWRAINDG